jgi:phosphoserine aminotransferase
MGPFSFAAGPCTMPPTVKQGIAADVRNWNGSSLSALELPFTGRLFGAILAAAETDLRHLLELPAAYRILFLQGGATAQFALLPMNLAEPGGAIDYVDSGYWSRRAIEEAGRQCDARVIAAGTATQLPSPGTWESSHNAAYCHFTSNESANGLQFHDFPEMRQSPLVVDMTGDFLTRPLPVERFALIYASAQKTLCATGLTIVIVHEALLNRAWRAIPAPFDLSRQAAAASKVNTLPTFSVLVAARMLRWLVECGGLKAAAARSRQMSAKLYDAIDCSQFYNCPVAASDRSLVNVCFRLPDTQLEEAFLSQAEASGLLNLRGHARIGGVRASIYNSTPESAVDALVHFMSDFRQGKA